MRDDLLELMNMRLKKVGFGEVKRENGRSDILIPSKNFKRHYFIYECKVGITLPKFRHAIRKLLEEYVAYHCKHTGIILFNKTASYSKKIGQIPNFIRQTGGIINEEYSNSEEYRCKYPQPSNKTDFVEVFICGINLA